jgi:hypothetical protein
MSNLELCVAGVVILLIAGFVADSFRRLKYW